MIVVGNLEHARTIAASTRTHFNPECDQVIARCNPEGNLLGGCLYQNYTGPGGSIGIHVASYHERWINRDILWICFHYPFVQLNCKKLFGQVPVTNRKALEFDLNLGFKIEATISDVFPDGDLYVISMLREDCRWLKVKPRGVGLNGRQERSTSPA